MAAAHIAKPPRREQGKREEKANKMGWCCVPMSLCLSLLCCIALPGHGAEADEVSVLLSIKSSLNDSSDALQDWAEESRHCNWTGVGCNSGGEVESLDLSHTNMSGNVTDHITRLPALVYLNLCCNSFSSSLPNSFSNLSRLKVFDVSDNLFDGHFPRGLGASPGLISVNASGNDFAGSLPEDLANATSLETLDFRGSYFEGTIPESYTKLKKLKYLGVSGNELAGRLPRYLGELSALETLIIGYNKFTGPIPPEIGNLTNLRYLDVAIGSFTGRVPAALGRLQHLNTVYLYKNKLEGEIPREFGNISSLAFMDLSDNLISGRIPEELGRLQRLQLLNLMCNRLVGVVPAVLGELRRLQVLALWNNSLAGSLPTNLGRNCPLRWLDVSSNSLSGEIPTGLCDGKNLTKLILFDNEFTGPIPACLSECLPLVRVRIHNNRLNGTIPGGLGKLLNLQRLEVARNDFGGPIPDDISSSTSLSFIDMSSNRIQSALPPGIFSIRSLQSFIASNNGLFGEVPDRFQESRSLTELDLSNNNHSGDIPTSLASCRRLVILDLSNNTLAGEIPSAIATMPSLSFLDLSDNHLTGSLPVKLGISPALESLNVAYNKLTGPVPANGALRTIDPSFLKGNPGLCGGVLPPCSGAHTPPEFFSRRSAHHKHAVVGWTVGVTVVFAFACLALGLRWTCRHWQSGGGLLFSGNRFTQESGEWPWRLTAFQRLNFTSGDILSCIHDSNVIGMGATGIVYRADLRRHHTTVAVKKLWRPESGVGGGVAAELAGEVSLLGRLRHRNIVRLLGFLHNDNDAMIVYEYMPNGSLWEVLHGGEKQGCSAAPVGMLLDWVSRYKVAAGVAQALAYLHHDCHPPVIHRDVKSNNILLDGNMEARIADFGLARMMLRKNETVSVVAGSYGYIAPEYGYTMKVDQKSDIYSFGVVLMELITGKKPIEPEFGECQDIVGWVREKLRRNRGLEEVLDRDVGGKCQHVQEEMLLVLRLAVLCTARLPKDRPSMRDVLTMLAEAKPRRKSSSSSSSAAAEERPVFITTAPSDHL